MSFPEWYERAWRDRFIPKWFRREGCLVEDPTAPVLAGPAR
jgi:hypothetical protein